jgi:two-component system response regulator WspF
MRIAIVNDLSLAREVLRRVVLSAPGYSIAWTAANGAEAVRLAAADRPDAVLMDLVMPVMDGVEATRRIMAESPCPVLVVTSTVSGNYTKVMEALSCGGMDAVNTPALGPGGVVLGGEGLLARLGKLARMGRTALPAGAAESPATPPPRGDGPPLLALGASTGGPEALAQVLEALPADFAAAVVVCQHIGADFAPSLASWLQGRVQLPVRLAVEGSEPQPGAVLVAGADDHLLLRPDRRLGYVAEPAQYPYRPSIDVLFSSLALGWPRPGAAVLLTGMGSDGARGLARLRTAGWYTIAQDQATSVVYGMPRAAVELHGAGAVLPLPRIGPALREHFAPRRGGGSPTPRPPHRL